MQWISCLQQTLAIYPEFSNSMPHWRIREGPVACIAARCYRLMELPERQIVVNGERPREKLALNTRVMGFIR